MLAKSFTIILEESFLITPRVKQFIFRSNSNPAFEYVPGQFITIHFPLSEKMLHRSYSIANAPENRNRIEFAASYVENGPGSELLFNLKPGDNLDITGPFGRLILKDEIPKRYIFVATSTGVTPYRAMITELKKRLGKKPDLKIVLLQGVQKKEDVLYDTEFTAFAKEFPQVSFRKYLSRELAAELQSGEYLGYVQKAFPELDLKPEEDEVYLCGNPAMIDESFSYLKEAGFPLQRIIREKYISGK